MVLTAKFNFNMKKIILLLSALLLNAISGATIGCAAGLAPITGAGIGIGFSALAGAFLPSGSLCAGVLTEVWTGEVIKALRDGANALFLVGLPDYSQYAENDVIHMIDVGVDPDVLINNTTYPLDIQTITDSDKTFTLDKYQTKATPITDDELYACSYDKIQSIKERHVEAINIKKYAKALHALAPASHTANTPVLETTGDTVDATVASRKRLTRADIIALKKKFDDLKIPVIGRRLVLCPDHVEDLLLMDQKFSEQYYNYTTGKIANLYGFEIFEYQDVPMYSSAGSKKTFNSVAETGDRPASVAFHTKNTFKANGSTKMYYSEAGTDPQNQRNLINFRHYYIVLPKRTKGCMAILSAATAAPKI